MSTHSRTTRVAVLGGMLCLVLSSAVYGQQNQNQPSVVALNNTSLVMRLDDLLAFRVATERFHRIETLYRRILERLGVEDSTRDGGGVRPDPERLLDVPASPQLIEVGVWSLLPKAGLQIARYLGIRYTVERVGDLLRGLRTSVDRSGPIDQIEGDLRRIENEVETIEASLGEVEIALTDILQQLDRVLPEGVG